MFLLRLISKLPLGFLYSLSNFLFFFTYRVFRYRRKVVSENLVNSLTEKSRKELHEIEKVFFKNLCDYSVETLKLLTISKEELERRMVFNNPGIIREYTDRGQSVIYLASHQFNWEWLLAAGSFSLPVPVDFVYQPQKSELANRFSLAIRTRFGGHPIEREKVGREALRRKDVVRGTAIVADQFPGHFNHRRYWTNFLGQRTAFFHGLAQLATLTQSPVFFSDITKTGRGFYNVSLSKIAEPPYDEKSSLGIIDSYVKFSEEVIHRQPEGWLWSHKRWKEIED